MAIRPSGIGKAAERVPPPAGQQRGSGQRRQRIGSGQGDPALARGRPLTAVGYLVYRRMSAARAITARTRASSTSSVSMHRSRNSAVRSSTATVLSANAVKICSRAFPPSRAARHRPAWPQRLEERTSFEPLQSIGHAAVSSGLDARSIRE